MMNFIDEEFPRQNPSLLPSTICFSEGFKFIFYMKKSFIHLVLDYGGKIKKRRSYVYLYLINVVTEKQNETVGSAEPSLIEKKNKGQKNYKFSMKDEKIKQKV